jgi:hypothetical protein
MRIINGMLLVLALQAWTGCSKDKGSTGSIDSSAFDSAPVSIKQSWQTAQDAAKHHDYVGAITNLMALGSNTLTSEQSSAVENSLDSVGAEAIAAAEKGNSEAVKAVQLIGRRRREN